MRINSKHKANSYSIYLEYNLRVLVIACGHAMCVWSGGACVTSRAWRSEDGPESSSFHCFEVLRFKHRLPSLLCQHFLYLLRHLAGPSSTITLFNSSSIHGVCLRPGRGGQVWIFFFHECTTSFGFGNLGLGVIDWSQFPLGTAAYFSSCASCSLQYPQFVTRIKQAS